MGCGAAVYGWGRVRAFGGFLDLFNAKCSRAVLPPEVDFMVLVLKVFMNSLQCLHLPSSWFHTLSLLHLSGTQADESTLVHRSLS